MAQRKQKILGEFYARNSWIPWGSPPINWRRPCISPESTRSCANSGRSPGSPTSAAFALVGVDLRRRRSPPRKILWDDAAVLDESSNRLRPAAGSRRRAPQQDQAALRRVATGHSPPGVRGAERCDGRGAEGNQGADRTVED